jgi:hypothetical protein
LVALFRARLAHSTRAVVVACPAENRAAWFDGHVRAFETWDGARAQIWYDNPSGLGSFRRGTFHPAPEFLALQSAYRFRAHHCTPGEGQPEGPRRGARRLCPADVPRAGPRGRLVRRAQRASGPRDRGRRTEAPGAPDRHGRPTVRRRAATPRPAPGPTVLPCTRHPVRASAQALVAFDGSRYSVPVRHASAALWLRAYARSVELWTGTGQVASHPRATAKGTLTTDFWQYLPALVGKPGAFANAI